MTKNRRTPPLSPKASDRGYPSPPLVTLSLLLAFSYIAASLSIPSINIFVSPLIVCKSVSVLVPQWSVNHYIFQFLINLSISISVSPLVVCQSVYLSVLICPPISISVSSSVVRQLVYLSIPYWSVNQYLCRSLSGPSISICVSPSLVRKLLSLSVPQWSLIFVSP